MDTIRLYYPREQDYKLTEITYQVDVATGVATATFNNPKKLNCLTNDQMIETFFILEAAKRDERVGCLLWTAVGRAFNAGMDIKFSKAVRAPVEAVTAYKARGMGPDDSLVLKNQTIAFWDFPKPLVFAINGMAIGGGANIALMNFADYIVCSEKAKFKYPFAKLGLTPELSSSYLMPYFIGMARAKEMMLLGDWFSARRALELGLCNQVVEHSALMEKATEVAVRLASIPANTSRKIKEIMNGHIRRKLVSILDEESAYEKEMFKTLQASL